MRRATLLFLLLSISNSVQVYAEDPVTEQVRDLTDQLTALTRALDELRAVVERQQTQIDRLEGENADLKSGQPQPGPAPALPPPSPLPTTAAASPGVAPAAGPRSSATFNPDIGLVVDIVGALTESQSDAEGNDRFSVREVELVVGHDIDPYSRFDSTITFSDFEDVQIEEAFVTFLELPGQLQVRAGRMRPTIGKASAMHRDQLDTVDEPLVVQRYLGAEGLFRTGVEVARYLPQFAGPLTQQVTLGILEGGIGEGGSLFGDTRRHATYFAHLKNAFDFSPSTNIEVGGTYLLGSSGPDDRDDVQAFGADLTLIHSFTSIRRLKWQSELYVQDRSDGAVNDGALGFYSLADFRASQRWGFGARYDWVELVNPDPLDPGDKDQAYTAYITFFESEFARLRLQYQFADLANGQEDNRFSLQGTFAVGVHKHRLQ